MKRLAFTFPRVGVLQKGSQTMLIAATGSAQDRVLRLRSPRRLRCSWIEPSIRDRSSDRVMRNSFFFFFRFWRSVSFDLDGSRLCCIEGKGMLCEIVVNYFTGNWPLAMLISCKFLFTVSIVGFGARISIACRKHSKWRENRSFGKKVADFCRLM